MFDLSQAKRVRREELYSPTSSRCSSPDPELQQLFRNRITSSFEAIDHLACPTGPETDAQQIVDEEEELDFRLFAPSSKAESSSNITKIRINSPVVDDRPPGLANPGRPRNYYFRDSLSPEAQEKINSAAISGDEVLARSKAPCPGCFLPWRVTTIAIAGISLNPELLVNTEARIALRKKKRKGKKARIAIRQKIAEVRDGAEKAKQAAIEKELADRMKKAKKNREKQQRKRTRDKLKAELTNGEEALKATEDVDVLRMSDGAGSD
ncbi:hypothetical protein EJ08DRAFT_663080 [Tothia fuscella]|uniref:Uncharacterized protein n=1 Tax=Tothia fuscella TaxID=1048955 RepID=A0A9P4NMC4_9PEZI|nr:hypothetical protein EJ08DRAFT_663080 [Tothia fuscella]